MIKDTKAVFANIFDLKSIISAPKYSWIWDMNFKFSSEDGRIFLVDDNRGIITFTKQVRSDRDICCHKSMACCCHLFLLFLTFKIVFDN